MRRGVLLLIAPLLAWQAAATSLPAQQLITTAAGGGPDAIPAIAASLHSPTTVLTTSAGELFVTSVGQHRLFKVDAQGQIHVVAGTGGTCYYSPYGDGGPARDACFYSPFGMALDSKGNLYFTDTYHHAVRKVDALTGLISRFAGDYMIGLAGDGGPATAAHLNRPYGLAFDRSGNLYIADRNNHCIRRVDAVTGIITTVAGTGKATGSLDGPGGDTRDDLGDGELATFASLKSPYGVVLDTAGNLYIGDTGNLRVRRVDAVTGRISTYAGDGTFGASSDGALATESPLAGPAQLALDSAGNLFIADSNDLLVLLPEDEIMNHCVRRVDAVTHVITTIGGGSGAGFGGDGGPVQDALLYRPSGLALDAGGNLLIADQYNNRIRKVTAATGIISTVAGSGEYWFSGDGFPAPSASITTSGIEVDAAGNLFIVDPTNGRVRRMDAATKIITSVAGNGSYPTSGDGGPALNAGFEWPEGLGLDAAGNLFITDMDAGRVRRVDHATGIITTVAGTGLGFGGDGGPATNALLNYPTDVAIAANGDIFIADYENQRIRRVRNGTITTVAGTGFQTGSIDGPGGDSRDDLGDGGQARQASLNYPWGVRIDPAGDLVIGDSGNSRIRRLDLGSGIISTIVGDGVRRFAGDGGPATAASLKGPVDAAYDTAGNLYIADYSNDRVRRVDALTGIITSVAGDGTRVWGPNGRLASSVSIYGPDSVAVDAAGRIYVSSSRYDRVRMIPPQPLAAGAVSDGSDLAVKPLDVTRLPDGDLTLAWGFSCTISDNDYVVYEGALGDWASLAPRICSTGGATAATITPGAGNRYYLVVPRNALVEGSLGARSDASPRPEPASACLTRLSGGTCP